MLRFAQLTDEDIPAWAGLLAVVFSRTPGQMGAYLRYLEPERRLLAWGVWDGLQLVGQYSCLLRQLHVPGCDAPSLVGMSINMAVHPDYRGRGLVKRLAEPVYQRLAEMGAVAGVGFSNAAGVQVDRHSKGYGYRVVGRMIPTITLLSRSHVPPLALVDEWPDLTFLPALSPRMVGFHPASQSIRRRFALHPLRQYRYGAWRDGDDLRGVVVYQTLRRRGFVGVALLGAYGDDLEGLLARWASAVSAQGWRFVYTLTSPNGRAACALRQVGWQVRLPWNRVPYYLTAKPLQADVPAVLFDFGAWDCTGGDIL